MQDIVQVRILQQKFSNADLVFFKVNVAMYTRLVRPVSILCLLQLPVEHG